MFVQLLTSSCVISYSLTTTWQETMTKYRVLQDNEDELLFYMMSTGSYSKISLQVIWDCIFTRTMTSSQYNVYDHMFFPDHYFCNINGNVYVSLGRLLADFSSSIIGV